MTRVALLPSAYLPSLGGVEELSRHLALALTRRGDEVEIWTQQSDDVRRATVEQLDGLTVRRFPFPLPASNAGSLLRLGREAPRTMAAMVNAARTFRPDLLHVQCFGPNGAYATVASVLLRTPLVISLQGETLMDDRDIFDTSTTLRTALRAGLRRAAAVTGCSQYALDDVTSRFGLHPGEGRVIFNGVSLSDAVPAAPPRADLPGRYVFAVGRLVHKKGFDLLLRAFSAVARNHPDVTLAIGGAGRAEQSLADLIRELRLDHQARLLGRLTRAEVASVMASADVFVMPSRLEPFGIVVLEAWRSERATIATTRGGPPEFVDDGRTGLLVDPFDTDALAAALDRLLRDQALRLELGQTGRAQVEAFDWPLLAGQYSDCYRSIAEATSHRGPS